MSGHYTVARIFVGFLGLTALLGVFWFAGSLRNVIVLAGVLLGLTSFAVVLIPTRKLSRGEIRRTLVTLCIVGIGAGIVLVADNINTHRGIEWDVLLTNILHVVALATMAVTAHKMGEA